MGKLRKYMPSFVQMIYNKAYYRYARLHPKYHASRLYKIAFGSPLNWDNPQNLTEKGRWIQFYTDTSNWPMLADKFAVRKYLSSLGLSEYLVKCYGEWENANDIDFNNLPESFVLKTNHGCGEIIVVKDKKQIEEAEIRKRMDKYLHTPYGVMTAEPHYLKIKPRIIAEQLLENRCALSTSMVDYKVFCTFGVPFALDICYDRNPVTHRCIETWYSPDWTKQDEWCKDKILTKDISKPKHLDIMYNICKIVAKDMPLVRIDFYEVDEKVYIGEITLTRSGFDGDSISIETQEFFGSLIDLSKYTGLHANKIS